MRGVVYSPFLPDLHNRALSKLRLKLSEKGGTLGRKALKKILYVTLYGGGRPATKLLQIQEACSMLPILCHYTPAIRKDR